jgi:hypothetical protein
VADGKATMVVGFCFQRGKKGEGKAGFYFAEHCFTFFFSFQKNNGSNISLKMFDSVLEGGERR